LNKENNLTGALHILVFDQERREVTIGRGSESHVRISDISVSRTHAIIELRDNKIFVRDNKSKFGTLVRMSTPISFIKHDERSYLQYGRTILGLAFNRYIPFTDILNNSKLIQEKEIQKVQEKENQRQSLQNQHQVQAQSALANTGLPLNMNQQNIQVHLENQ
jgi:hypothetical protein